jgi:pectate lyase
MIVSGFGKASNVTISWNEFDGSTDFSATCDGKHYWGLLLLGADDTISFLNNLVHDTAGRMPHAGGMNNATVTMHIANNLFQHISGHAANPQTPLARLLLEANYFDQVVAPVQIDPARPGLAFAPIGTVSADAARACSQRLQRACVVNLAEPMPRSGLAGFPLDGAVIDAFAGHVEALIVPYPADRVPNLVPHLAGTGHINQD